ncbi:MAG: 23S rRNA (adenine(2503)-C(2))-methyltransferase RlmN [Candidatus Uhrbacteria bacterium]|nr:23S rRNA (adenine(2503)-C(2))-methyltransferase RlmN [Candidatus Uhrbacteria bacterium]
MNFEKLKTLLTEQQEPAYRLAQAERAFYIELADRWEEMAVYPKALRQRCAEALPWKELSSVHVQESPKGDTVKTLFACADGQKIEAVLMCHQDERNTVCVSSQIGCAMACTFCATGTMGIKRNLTSGEIIEQVLHYARLLKIKNERVSNVVFMGMGEPMHNYDAVLSAIRTLNHHDGFNLGARHFSISTCGVVPGILRLADEPLQINLAISLHSAINEIRSSIMPVNRAYPLEKLMPAVRVYMEKTNRKVMFEYLLLKGINDRPEDARALAKLLGPDFRLAHVNLIKYHETEMFQGTSRGERVAFLDELRALHVPATHRITFGEDIDAACGQLAVREEQGRVKQGLAAVRAAKARVLP